MTMYELPIFPLHTVLFPGMPLQVQVFEERYKLMVQKVLSTNGIFGVCLIKSGEEALGPLPAPYPTGCTARILKVERVEGERLNLTVIGDERFRITTLSHANPYLTGFVVETPIADADDPALLASVGALQAQIARYLRLLAHYTAVAQNEAQPPDEIHVDMSEIEFPSDPMMMLHMAAALLQVAPLDKQPLLEVESAPALLEGVRRLLRREMAVLPVLIAAPPDIPAREN